MKNRWKLLMPLSMLAVLIGCSKEDDSTNYYEDEHRFFLQAHIKGQPVQLKAGNYNYYLETDYQLQDGILQSSGMLAPDGNIQREAVMLIYRSPQKLQDLSQFRRDSNMSNGPMAFRDASSFKAKVGHFNLLLSIDSNISMMNPKWTLPDGSTYQQQSLSVEVNANEKPVFPVKLGFSGPGCKSEITHHFKMFENCEASFDVHALGPYGLKITPKGELSQLHQVQWFINNEQVDLQAGGIHQMLLQNHTSITIRGKFIFKGGCEKLVEREFFPALDNCLPEFKTKKTQLRIHDADQLGTMEIIYYDKNGTPYSSNYEHVNGQFMVLASLPYQQNETGQNTTRFFFETDVLLKSATGDTLRLKNAYGSFAIAHP